MAITTEQQTRILQMTQAMFGAAPGATYLAAFESSVAAGTTVAALAQSLSGTAIFFGNSYSASLTSAQFAEAFVTDLVGSHASTADKAWATGYIVDRMAAGATQAAIIAELTQALSSVAPENVNWGAAATNYNTSIATKIVGNLAGSSASAADKADAINYMVSQMAAGQSVGQMVDWAITALDSVAHTDGTWGEASTLFDNRIEVSQYYSVDKAGTATDLGTLQQALAAVTASAASVATAKAMFDTPLSGRAQDGYLSGATVFVDLNGDGIHNPGETSVTTDAAGNFTLPAGAFGRIVASGGTDIATNLPFSGSFTAPAGSTVVNPLTTLVQSMVEQGMDSAAAMTQVQIALGLSADTDLSSFDPIAELSGANASQAQAVLAAAVQVNNLFTMVATAMTGAEAGLSMQTAFAQVVTAMTAQITAATATLDLADATMLEAVHNASAGENTTLAASMAVLSADISQMVADNNGTIAAILAGGGEATEMLAQFMQVATVAQGDAAEALLAAIEAGTTDLTTIIADYTGDAFDDLVNAVDLGDVDGDGTTDVAIDLDGTTVTPPPAADPVVVATFTVTETAGVVEFGGTATGNITFAVSGGTATFTRGGVTATTTVADITTKTVNVVAGQTVAATSANLTAVNGLVITGAGTLSVTEAVSIAQLAGIDLTGFTGTATYSLSDIAASYADTSGVMTAGGTALVAAGTNVTITDTATLAQLATVDTANTTGTLTYAGITGVVANYFSSGTTQTANATAYVTGSHAVTVTGGAISVAQANALDALSTGVVTAAATETDAATLVTLTTANTDMITVTMAAASTTAANLNTIDAATGVAVGATAITELTGAAADVKTALGSAGITTVVDSSLAVGLTGSTSVADIILVQADSATGVITTAATETDAATLVTLTTANTDMITVTMAAAST
ncbi:MAG: hypothetical protein OEV73_08615, partial [Desulfobulbaceae bacterium]|nr:hypothetical protein [Desulfobulbaceae bacterium]HIJ91705.1 hypothetical protein [Deltaproteobacteria bacterium]